MYNTVAGIGCVSIKEALCAFQIHNHTDWRAYLSEYLFALKQASEVGTAQVVCTHNCLLPCGISTQSENKRTVLLPAAAPPLSPSSACVCDGSGASMRSDALTAARHSGQLSLTRVSEASIHLQGVDKAQRRTQEALPPQA